MYFILFYKTAGDYMERRPAYRAEHLALAQAALERGEIVLAGALADPAVEWHVRTWTVVIGHE